MRCFKNNPQRDLSSTAEGNGIFDCVEVRGLRRMLKLMRSDEVHGVLQEVGSTVLVHPAVNDQVSVHDTRVVSFDSRLSPKQRLSNSEWMRFNRSTGLEAYL